MENKQITTYLGNISISIDGASEDEPLVFLHGMFMDKTLWEKFGSKLTGRKHIYIDMPAHGSSSNVEHKWSLDDCVDMLMTVLDELTIKRCIIIGHSWGSMTGLRAAHKYPSRFSALGLFNMRFKRIKGISRAGFNIQKLLSMFPKFYAKQAAKSLYSQSLLLKRPELLDNLQRNLSSRPSKEIRQILDAVILNANDAINLIQSLKVPAFAVVGEEDASCTAPPELETLIVSGGHVSPYEAPEEILSVISNVIKVSMT